MKKTFPANINGSIFYIDEDAYTLLNTYLEQLRKAFPGDEGMEISADIEARISEHFTERINEGARVIVLDDVNRVIKIMGEPAQLAGTDGSDDTSKDSSTTPPPYNGAGACPPPAPPVTKKRLYRNPYNTVFGGVFGGLGVYMGWNVNILRVIAVVLALCVKFWPMVLAYLIAWIVIPLARTPRQLLEMQGAPVTPGSVGATVLGTADASATPPVPQAASTSFFSVLGKIVMAFVGFIAGCVGFGFICVFFVCLCGLITYWAYGDLGVLAGFDINPAITHPVLALSGVICLSLAIILPCLGLVWGAICALFNARGASRSWIIAGIVLEVLLIAATIFLLHTASLGCAGENFFTASVCLASFSAPLQIA